MQLNFQENLGITDRLIRILIGILLISFTLTSVATTWLLPFLLYFAGLLILEAALGY